MLIISEGKNSESTAYKTMGRVKKRQITLLNGPVADKNPDSLNFRVLPPGWVPYKVLYGEAAVF